MQPFGYWKFQISIYHLYVFTFPNITLSDQRALNTNKVISNNKQSNHRIEITADVLFNSIDAVVCASTGLRLLQATQKLHFKLNQLIDINWLGILLNEFSCAVPVSRNFPPLPIAFCKQVIINGPSSTAEYITKTAPAVSPPSNRNCGHRHCRVCWCLRLESKQYIYISSSAKRFAHMNEQFSYPRLSLVATLDMCGMWSG